MATILTYVSSHTYDELLGIMYPDETAKERTLEEIERLIVQGHSIEHRFGDNMTTLLDLDKFNTYVKPKYQEEKVIDTTINDLQHQLNNLFPDTSLSPIVDETVVESQNDPVNESELILQPFDLTPTKIDIPKETTEEIKEEVIVVEDTEKETKLENDEEVKDEVIALPEDVVEIKSTKKNKK